MTDARGAPETHPLLGLALDLSPAGILAVDRDGRMLLVNREIERLFGYRRDELIGRSIETLIPGRFRHAHTAHRAGFDASPRTRPMGAGRDLFGVRKDGVEFPVEIGLNPVDTPEGAVVLASVVDITERLRADERLRQSQKMEAIGTLAGGIAHDFNNLLFGIVGYAQLASKRAGHDTQLAADLGEVLSAAERGRQLVQRILAFSRQGEGKRRPIRIDAPLSEALKLVRATVPSTIEIVQSIDPNAPEVTADDAQIHQVVMNLATNAAHAMRSGGRLEVRLEPFEATPEFADAHPGIVPGPYVRLTFADTGVGMTPEVVARALEPFFTTRGPGEGSGLGLSIVHGIVSSHGGAMDIRSEPGEGTRLDLHFPAARRDAGSMGMAPVEAATAPHVLIVEDEGTLLAMLQRQVIDMGYRATAHGSSVEALEDFRARPEAFDLLITDNTMPRMTGLALARAVVGLRPELPVLLISGLAENADPRVLTDHGVRKILGKPHRSAELQQAITDLLSSRPAHRA